MEHKNPWFFFLFAFAARAACALSAGVAIRATDAFLPPLFCFDDISNGTA
jgi:hypothetical protein